MTDTELEDKFRELAGRVIGRKQTDAALRILWRIEQADNVACIFDAVRIGA